MWSTAELLRLLATVPLAMLFALLLRDHRDDRSARATLVFLVCTLGNALLPLFPVEKTGALPAEILYLLSSLVAASFWVLAKVHFDDDFRLGGGHLALLAFATVVAWLCWHGLSGRLPAGLAADVPTTLFVLLPKLIGLAFIVHALLTVYVGTRSDLVVARLKLRYPVLWLTGTYIFVKLLTDAVVLGTPAEKPADALADLARFLLAATLVAASLRVRSDLLRPSSIPAWPRSCVASWKRSRSSGRKGSPSAPSRSGSPPTSTRCASSSTASSASATSTPS
jgi:hypothetical protein